MEFLDLQWINLFIRWFHITTGIAWIGASFYFNWLEGNLNRLVSDQEKEGDLWAIHGGGFYHVNKYKVAPANLPPDLHWFKYEAYFTWITGMALLFVGFYLNAKSFLIEPEKMALSGPIATLIGLASILTLWLIYHAICKSGLTNRLLFVIFFALFTAYGFTLCQIFAARGAFIHCGAAIGTIMVANVFFVIIPNQKKVVQALLAHETPDPSLGKKALQRSLHNNYLTLPVLFLMVSGHYPIVYSHPHPWLILCLMSLLAVWVRHFFNLKNRGRKDFRILLAAALGFLVLAIYTSKPKEQQSLASSEGVPFYEVKSIVAKRCLSCHSLHPTDLDFQIAPNGMMLDNDSQIEQQAEHIWQRVVQDKTMPLANRTNMTDEERSKIATWILARRPTKNP